MDKLQDINCQPNHLWKGQKAIKKLRELSKGKPAAFKKWLTRQAIWQVDLAPPKRVDRPHYEVMIPNQIHQFDLLYMPSRMLYEKKYKYLFSGIDIAFRYKVVRPLRMKLLSLPYRTIPSLLR